MITIAIDTMSGDFGPAVTVPASVRALSFNPDIKILLLGDNAAIQSELTQCGCYDDSRLRIVHTTQVVGMGDKPAQALRHAKDSSLYRGIQLLSQNEVQAFVSAGNTGALMMVGCHLLRLFDGIDRPAICTAIPTQKGQALLLDIGANVDVRAAHLQQFAVMGSVFASAVMGVKKPRVGLLNIGIEGIKGNESVKEAAELLQANATVRYTGFVEADQLFFDIVDVAVCDGFVGNVALKAGEGAAKLIRFQLKQLFDKNIFYRFLGVCIAPLLKQFCADINPSRYNGASFLGFTSTLVKSHGGADADAFFNAIIVAKKEAIENIPQKIHQSLQQMFAK